MHWAPLGGSRKHGSRRGESHFVGRSRVRQGMWAGALCSLGLGLGLLGSGCSFNLPGRVVCTTADCTGDMGAGGDMAKDPADPNLAGSYKVATVSINPAQPQLGIGQLFLPSEDGSALSTRMAKYPLVLLAPAQYLDIQQLAVYAQRLASHGIVVALYRPLVENDQGAYRQTGLDLITYLLGGTEPAVTNRLDNTHIGLAGYELGAEISVAIANMVPQTQAVRGLYLLDPQVVAAFMNPINATEEMSKVKLASSQPVLMIGEQVGKVPIIGQPPCTPPATNYEQYQTASPTGTIVLSFTNASYTEFVDTLPVSCQAGSMAKAETQRLAIKYMTAYFQWTLLERTTAQMYLTGAGFDADAKQYAITRTIK